MYFWGLYSLSLNYSLRIIGQHNDELNAAMNECYMLAKDTKIMLQ